MTTEAQFYFAQLTDIHIGGGLNPKEAAENLRWALGEIETLSPRPNLILATGDLVCAGAASDPDLSSAADQGMKDDAKSR